MSKKELLVEYMPMKSEGMIADFYYGDYDTLVLDSGYTIFYNQDGILLNCIYDISKHKIESCYKIYYLILKDEFQYNFYPSDYDDIRINLKKAYSVIFNYNVIKFKDKNGKIDEKNIARISHKTEYTFTDLKKGCFDSLNEVIGRHIYSNKEVIKNYKVLDLLFKAPFRLIAKKTGDVGFHGSDGVKASRFLIDGIRLVKKNYPCIGNGFIEEEYYFREKYPERYVLE